MKTYNNYDIYGHNTMKLHCIAETVYIPENEEELKTLVEKMHQENKKFYFLGAGSNVVLPERLKTPVVILTSFNKELVFRDGRVECGASVRIQHLIREAQKHGFGGIEYLFSVPCSVGGAAVMNAGRGKGQAISDYIESVRCFNMDTGEIEILGKNQCGYNYRRSIFLHGNRIILSVLFRMAILDREEIEKRINERKLYAEQHLDDRRPSCGSIFNHYNKQIMDKLKGVRVGGAEWSPKKSNWISNRGTAKSKQIRLLIGMAVFIHKILFKKYHIEVEIWKK